MPQRERLLNVFPLVALGEATNRRRRLALLIGGGIAAVVAVVAVACGGGGEESVSRDVGEAYEASIGPDGGRIEIPETDDVLPGVTLIVPPGAVSAETQFSVQAEGASDATPLDLAGDEPSMHLALVEDAFANTDNGAHPMYGPILALSSAEFAGPGLLLGPDGAEFAAPVEVVMPLSLLAIDEPSSALPILRGADGRWEGVEDFSIDAAAGAATVRVSHFSVLKWISNAIDYRSTKVNFIWNFDKFLQARASLPQDTFQRFVQGAVCSGREPHYDRKRIPGLLTMIDYLGFERVRVESGQEDALETWIRGQFDPDNRESHHIPLGDVFGTAMELNDGDVFQALVTAHNVLRDNRDKISIHGPLQNYRGDGGDERGGRYHLFGTAIYSFAFEYWQAFGINPLRQAISPEVVVDVEESIIAGTILSDMTEYAIDLQGVELGRQLSRQVAPAELAELASNFGISESDCPGEEVVARGSLNVPDSEDFEVNEIVLTYPAEGGDVTGEFTLAFTIDVAELFEGFFGSEGGDSCIVTSTTSGEMRGTYEGVDLSGTATSTTFGTVVSGCEDVEEEALRTLEPVSTDVSWSATFDGQQVDGQFDPVEEGDERLTFTAAVESVEGSP